MEKREPISFRQAWLCEAVHLRESQWGPLDDSKARRLAQHELTPLSKVVRRAQALSESNGLISIVNKLSKAGWLAFFLLLILAAMSGASIGFASLGNSAQPVNIVTAIFVLLGLNSISLILWCVTIFSTHASGGLLAQLWPKLTLMLARGPNIGLVVQAWWSVWRQANATRWLFSTCTHLIWVTIMVAAGAAMIFALSTRQYDFVWETTVLSSDVFVKWVGRLAVVPQWLGFVVPDEDLIRASGSLSHHNAEVTRRLWSGWLLGCLVAYGILPRVILSLISAFIVSIRRLRIGPDVSAPYYVAVLHRMPASEQMSEGHAPHPSVISVAHANTPDSDGSWNTDNLLIAIEPDPNDPWPPAGIGTAVTCIGPIDSRESRRLVLDRITLTRAKNLVLVCDARHSPDRGTLRLISDLSECSKRTLIWLRHSQTDHAHTEAWLSLLRDLPNMELRVRDDALNVMQWLERHHD